MEKELIKVEEVRKVIEEVTKDEEVRTIQLGDIRINGNVTISGKEHAVGKEVVQEFVTALGVPYGYYKKCGPTLREDNLNYWLSKEGDKPYQIRTVKDVLENLLPQSYLHVPLTSLFDLLTDTLGKVDLTKYEIDRGTGTFDFVIEEAIEAPKRPGDFSRGGLLLDTRLGVDNYDSNRIQIEGYIYRMVCSNGMITSDKQQTYIRGNSVDEILERVRTNAILTLEAVKQRRLPQFVNLDNIPIDDPAKMVHQIGKREGLSSRLEERVLDKVPALKRDSTMFDLVNLVTNTANDEGLKSYQSRSLQRLGGVMTETVEHRCSNCMAVLN